MRLSFLILILVSSLSTLLLSCSQATSTSTAVSASAANKFASGTKAVTIIANNTSSGSFWPPPVSVPVSTTVIPSTFPGGNGTSTYLPGVSPTVFFDAPVNGNVIVKPSWLLDFQMGITNTNPVGTCAAFGSAATMDVQNYYRVSEPSCGAVANGSGQNNDPVFFRIVLDRTDTQIGTAENLIVQVEYQASAVHLNSDLVAPATTLDQSVDQLWRIFWNDTLKTTSTPKTFATFVPPNYAACIATGTGTTSLGTATDNCYATSNPNYRGAPIKTRQFIIPLSTYPTMQVIQFSRVTGRINQGGTDYVHSFCNAPNGVGPDAPLCAGVVIRSVTLMRI